MRMQSKKLGTDTGVACAASNRAGGEEVWCEKQQICATILQLSLSGLVR